MVEPFPKQELRDKKKDAPDFSPGIRLFGRRFPSDQTAPDLLLELLLVAISPKSFSENAIVNDALFPELDRLRSVRSGCSEGDSSNVLAYAPKARLNLKLLAFLGASKLDTRHETHRQQYRQLIRQFIQPEMLVTIGAFEAHDVFRTIENLFVGFQGAGANRTWCAQSFLPLARELIAGESIWQETKAGGKVASWSDARTYFSHNQQIFLARGGELLYLQLCNALRQDASTIEQWVNALEVRSLNSRESEPSDLYSELTQGLESVLLSCPETVGKLAEFLDTGLDAETAQKTDFDSHNERRFATCGWCPEECWPEGYLFAVEISRLCHATIDPIERLELLEIACAMQVLRSLCSQAARYTTRSAEATAAAGPLGYVWVISDPAGKHTAVKQISRRNVNAVQRLIYDALRDPRIKDFYASFDQDEVEKVYADADRRYGHKLFLTVAKRLGFITPRRGAGARFVLNDRLLRYLVLSTIRPGERVTYDSFKKLLFAHHGLAVDDQAIGQSCLWSGTSRLTTLGGNADEWLLQMLDASGVLIRLSDACSLVTNPFGGDVSA